MEDTFSGTMRGSHQDREICSSFAQAYNEEVSGDLADNGQNSSGPTVATKNGPPNAASTTCRMDLGNEVCPRRHPLIFHLPSVFLSDSSTFSHAWLSTPHFKEKTTFRWRTVEAPIHGTLDSVMPRVRTGVKSVFPFSILGDRKCIM